MVGEVPAPGTSYVNVYLKIVMSNLRRTNHLIKKRCVCKSTAIYLHNLNFFLAR